MKNIAVIPARREKGEIPKKNLRPLNGEPLISYVINKANNCKLIDEVFVTTESDEIAFFASRFGAEIIDRPDHLAEEGVVLAPVLDHAVRTVEQQFGFDIDNVVVLQPTSPLVSQGNIRDVIELLEKEGVDTVFSAVTEKHLTWKKSGNEFVPNYESRVSTEDIEPNYWETGALYGGKRRSIKKDSRVGEDVEIYIQPPEKGLAIQSYEDWWKAEKILSQQKVLFVVQGNEQEGMGLVYRALLIAHELIYQDVYFISTENSEKAHNLIKQHHFSSEYIESDDDLIAKVLNFDTDMVINEIHHTSYDYVNTLKQNNIKVVNFADFGEGAIYADLVINALYDEPEVNRKNFLVGPQYFCLRDEFVYGVPDVEDNGRVDTIFITFGGSDPSNSTMKVLGEISDFCAAQKISVNIVTGPAYNREDQLKRIIKKVEDDFEINWVRDTDRISYYMNRSDIAFCSAGRTSLELAALKIPTILICHNQHESTHSFAKEENGFLNLGLASELADGSIMGALEDLYFYKKKRDEMKRRLGNLNVKSGRKRVVRSIKQLLNE